VTANDSFFQKQRPAAVLKHSVLKEYLRVFASMVGSSRTGPIWFIDGYAGPGAYAAASDAARPTAGSPLVAMTLAGSLKFSGQRDLQCAFIENDPAYAAELRTNLEPFRRGGLNPIVLEGSVEDELPRAWKLVSDAPVITFLDPFGVNAVPVDLMTRLLARRRPTPSEVRPTPSEVLLNINVEAVGRLGGCLEERGGAIAAKPGLEKSVDRVDRFIGDTSWRMNFYQARNSPMASAASAAESVIARYRQDMARTTGCASMSVPIRRRPGNPPLVSPDPLLPPGCRRVQVRRCGPAGDPQVAGCVQGRGTGRRTGRGTGHSFRRLGRDPGFPGRPGCAAGESHVR